MRQKLEDLSLSSVDLNTLVAQSVALRQSQAEERGLKLAFNEGDNLPSIEGEPAFAGTCIGDFY